MNNVTDGSNAKKDGTTTSARVNDDNTIIPLSPSGASTLPSEVQAVDIDRLELDVPYALYVGNLAPNKAPEVLVRSLEILSSKGNPLNVYHIGRDEKDLLSHAARRSSLTRPVRSIGQLSDSALARAYSRATCLIVTSTHEGFCLPVLEAQSFGTPVICSGAIAESW